MRALNGIYARAKGFTLIELQLSIFIACITIVAALSLYIFYWRTFVIGNTVLDVYSSSRIAMGWVARDIRSADQVAASYTSGGTTYTTGDHVIVLEIPSIDTAGNIVAPDDDLPYYDHIIYQLQADKLRRIQNIDSRFNISGKPYYHQNGRLSEDRTVTDNCTLLTFSSGGVTLSHISDTDKPNINTVSIYLPLNKKMISLSGSGTETASITPTTLVRLRNNKK